MRHVSFFLSSSQCCARCHAELALLPDVLRPSTSFGDALLHDQTLVNSIPTNASHSSLVGGGIAGTNADQNDTKIGGNGEENGRHFMCLPGRDRSGAGIGADSVAQSTHGRTISGKISLGV